MPSIIYDVAVSVDGFISGPDGDISGFPAEGPVVDDYLQRLSTYRHAIMGRATYEFGYQFGLSPGENPYPEMETMIFSETINLPGNSQVEVVRSASPSNIEKLRREAKGPIYLCGGGQFAGWLLTNGLIDTVRLKRAPIILGSGTALFGGNIPRRGLNNLITKSYDNGYIYQEFELL